MMIPAPKPETFGQPKSAEDANAYIATSSEETPSTLLIKGKRIIVDCFHNSAPGQIHWTFRDGHVTGTEPISVLSCQK